MSAMIVMLCGTGLTFFNLKIDTVLIGLLTLPLICLIGKETVNRSIGLYASLFANIAYWQNVISRIRLRFFFYPLFTALPLYLLIRGINTSNRAYIVWGGLPLGFSFYGYTADRIIPIVVVSRFILWALRRQGRHRLREALWGLSIAAVMVATDLIPLARYVVEGPGTFFYRSLTRLTDLEQPLQGSSWMVFGKNLFSALGMFSYSGGNVFLASTPFYPARGIVSGTLFYLGTILLLISLCQRAVLVGSLSSLINPASHATIRALTCISS